MGLAQENGFLVLSLDQHPDFVLHPLVIQLHLNIPCHFLKSCKYVLMC